MKKLLLIFVPLLLLLAGGIGYVLFFMEDTPLFPGEEAPQASRQEDEAPQDPQLNVMKEAETPADVLDALDYETTANRDTVGWLTVPGTKINNSVLQSYDNLYYLRRNERRESEIYGCYYVDYECSVGGREVLSPNTVIYGHSDLTDTPDGPRFSQLFHFTDPEFAQNTPTISFSTLEEFMDWQVFAVFYTDLSFNFISAYPADGVEQMAATAMEKSMYDYGVTVGPEDKVLVLSTCTGKFGEESDNYRFVVMAKLLPQGAELPQQAELTMRDPSESQEVNENV